MQKFDLIYKFKVSNTLLASSIVDNFIEILRTCQNSRVRLREVSDVVYDKSGGKKSVHATERISRSNDELLTNARNSSNWRQAG